MNKDLITPSNKDSKVVSRLKEKMNECGGKSKMIMLKGEPLNIYLSFEKERIVCSSFPSLLYEWHIFDAIVNKANQLGGKMYRWNGASQSGAKLGSKELPIDTIDGFIALKFYCGEIGKSILRRSTYYASVLVWA